MRLRLLYVSLRRDRLKSAPAQELVHDYVTRAGRLCPIAVQPFRSEAELLQATLHRVRRTPAYLILMDSRGRELSSEEFASRLRELRDKGTQEVCLAIGPADGWSAATRDTADAVYSLGPMTLPHELALVLLAEQTYRALSILAGHPYHSGHE